MKPSNPQAQPGQDQTKPLTVDFSHRLSPPFLENTFISLSDTVDVMAYQATSILNVLSDQFLTAKDEDARNRASDEIIYWTIEAAIKEIQDIKQVVRAYYYANQHANKHQAESPESSREMK